MKDYIEKELIENFPVLLRKDNSKWPYDLFGIECGDGWSNLLLETFARIKSVLEKNELPLEAFKVDQIKEKFGGLRLYYHMYGFYPDDVYSEIDAIITDAENKSFVTCEICGSSEARINNEGGWLFTRCDSCKKSLNELFS